MRAPSANRLIWVNLYAAWIIWRKGLDLYHALDNLSLPLFWPKGKTGYVLTVHDLIPLLFSQSVKKHHAYYFHGGDAESLADSLRGLVIVESEWLRSAIQGHIMADLGRERPAIEKTIRQRTRD